MINLYRQDGEILYGIKDFLLDTEEDLLDLANKYKNKVGSTAFIISTGQRYILNGYKKWVLLSTTNGTSTDTTAIEELLNQIDQDRDGVIDLSESTSSIEMISF